MTVTDAWTDPSEGGSLDRDVGDVLTDACYDGLCSDLLNLGGTDGLRLKKRGLLVYPAFTGASSYSAIGNHVGHAQSSSGATTSYGKLVIPQDFSSLLTFKCIYVANATGNIYVAVAADYGTDGESYNAHTYSGSYAAVAVTINTIKFIDHSAALASIAAGDIVGVSLSRDGAHASDTAGTGYLLGWLFEYRTA